MITQDEYGRIEITTKQDEAYDVVNAFLEAVEGDVEKVECRIRHRTPQTSTWTYEDWNEETDIAGMQSHLSTELGVLYGNNSDYIAVIWIIVHKEE